MAIDEVLFEKLYTILTLLTMGLFFWATTDCGTKKASVPKICLLGGNTEFFLGGSSTIKCDHDYDQVLIKGS